MKKQGAYGPMVKYIAGLFVRVASAVSLSDNSTGDFRFFVVLTSRQQTVGLYRMSVFTLKLLLRFSDEASNVCCHIL